MIAALRHCPPGTTLAIRGLVVVIVAGLMASCSRNEPKVLGPFENRSHGLYPGQGETTPPPYRIGAGDVLDIAVHRHREFDGTVEVSALGEVTLPLSLDRLKLQGLTLAEAEEAVAGSVRRFIVDEPRAHVRLRDTNSRFVYVLGAVRAPGKYPMSDERLFVREAVVRAGLHQRTAALKRTLLVSSGPDHSRTRQINLKEILYRGDLGENYEMKAGDIVWVPHSWVSEFVWHANQLLQPLAVLLGFDSAVTELSDPLFRDRVEAGGDWNKDRNRTGSR